MLKWSSFPLSNFSYKVSFLFCLGGFVGILELGSLPEFILSISASDTSSAEPKTVALRMVRVTLLKFKSRTCVLSDLLSARSVCEVAGEVLQIFDAFRVSVRAGRTSMGIRAGSTQTSDGCSSFPSSSNLAITTCRHLGAKVTFSLALISQVLHCVVALVREGWLGAARPYAVPSVGWIEGSPSLPLLQNECRAHVSRFTTSSGCHADLTKGNFLTL